MANKIPLCLYTGKTEQLQSGDTIDVNSISLVTNLNANSTPLLSDVFMEQSGNFAANTTASLTNMIGLGVPSVCDFRLSAAVSTPVTTTDQTSVGTLYLVPVTQQTPIPSIRATTTAHANSTSCTITLPTHVAGDLLLLQIAWNFSTFASIPSLSVSGYTPYIAGTTLGLPSGPAQVVYYKYSSGLESSTLNINTSSTTTPVCATMFAIQGGGIPENGTTTGSSSTVTCTNVATQGPFRLMIVSVAASTTTSFSVHSANSNYTDAGFVSQTNIGQQVGTWSQSAQAGSSTFTLTPASVGDASCYAIPASAVGRIALYNTSFSNWSIMESTQVDIALTATSGTVYDVWAYNSSGVLTLDTTAWTNTTTRATPLQSINGVLVKASDYNRRYMGTFYANGTNTTEDSAANRLIWNQYYRVPRQLVAKLPTGSGTTWTYTTNTWRAANNSTTLGTYAVSAMIGNSYEPVNVRYTNTAANANGWYFATGIGVNSTSVNSAQIFPGANYEFLASSSPQIFGPTLAEYDNFPGIGYNTFQALEISNPDSTTTWNYNQVAFALTTPGQNGMIGRVYA